VVGGGWRRERHGFDSLPLYVREGAVLPLGEREDRPDTDHLVGLTLTAFPGAADRRGVRVAGAKFTVETSDTAVTARGPVGTWRLRLGAEVVDSVDGSAMISL
jgi:alpha-D-xyloside xylohydrolase